MLYNEKLLYTNSNNESINIGYDFELIPVSFEDDVDNEVYTSKFARQHGSTFVSSALSDRHISITFTYAIRNALAIEKEVLRVVNPSLEATLYKINSFGEKFIKVRPLSVPTPKRMKGRGEITIDLIACDTFYQSETVIERLAKQTPKTRFPLYWTSAEQRIFGVYTDVIDTEIQNKGDVDTGFTITFKCSGSVKNPSIINNATGETIKLNIELEQGDEVEIINMPFYKQVIVNGVKNFSALNRNETTFFDLVVGKNSLRIGADENIVNMSAVISYSPKFL